MTTTSFFIYSFAMLIALNMTACSGGGGNSKPAAQGGADDTGGSTTTVTINGQTPNAYYAHFYFKDHGCDRKDGAERFDFLNNEWMTIGKTEDGHIVKGTFEINLYADHSFYAIYKQDIILKVYPNGIDYETDQTKSIVRGNWSIDKKGSLVLPQLGVAKGITYNGHESLMFKPVSEFQFDPKNPDTYLLETWSGNTDVSGQSPQCQSDGSHGG